ncbi:hypothetical protein ACU4GD_30980 [Cupriavidus basilensis]
MSARSRPAERLLPILSQLRMEVRRAQPRSPNRLTLKRAANGTEDYYAHLAGLFDRWIEDSDFHTRVVCFASATEFGMAMQHHAEPLPGARPRRSGSRCAARAVLGVPAPYPGAARPPAPDMPHPARGRQPEAAPRIAGPWCARCESLRHDARCADGHAALRLSATSKRSWRGRRVPDQGTPVPRATPDGPGAGVSDPFTGWTVTRHAASIHHDGSIVSSGD